MSFDNPLNFIRSLNEKKKQEEEVKQEDAPEVAESLETGEGVIDQNVIDQEHADLEEKKRVLVEDVEKIKQRLEEIGGTREEMIAQYHEAIVEAKKNPETLAYVREHFSEIFKDGKEKWQELGSELGVIKESERSKEESLNEVDSAISDKYPLTSAGKEAAQQEKTAQESKEWLKKHKLEMQQETVRRLEENIENGKRQKEDYADILGQRVEYTRENYMSGEAKVISDDAKEFTRMWREFPAHPFVIGGHSPDNMVSELQKKRYSDSQIETYKQKREQLRTLKEKINASLQLGKARCSNIGYARHNDIDYPSYPYITIGHGNHYLDNALLGKQMSLGELLDRDIEIKTRELEVAKVELKNLEEEGK